MNKYSFIVSGYPESDNTYYQNMVAKLPGKAIYRTSEGVLPAITSDGFIQITGLTDAGAAVKLYNNSVWVKDVTADAGGSFVTTVPLVYNYVAVDGQYDVNVITGTSNNSGSITNLVPLTLQMANTHLILNTYGEEIGYANELETMVKNDNALYLNRSDTIVRSGEVSDKFTYPSNRYLQDDPEILSTPYQLFRVYDYPVIKFSGFYIDGVDQTEYFSTSPILYREIMTPDVDFRIYDCRFKTWIAAPAAIVYRNGVVVSDSNYTIDYSTGHILFTPAYVAATPLEPNDVVTGTFAIDGEAEGVFQYMEVEDHYSIAEYLKRNSNGSVYLSKQAGWLEEYPVIVIRTENNGTAHTLTQGVDYTVNYPIGSIYLTTPPASTDSITAGFYCRTKPIGAVTVDYTANTISEISQIVDPSWDVKYQEGYVSKDSAVRPTKYSFGKASWVPDYSPTVYRQLTRSGTMAAGVITDSIASPGWASNVWEGSAIKIYDASDSTHGTVTTSVVVLNTGNTLTVSPAPTYSTVIYCLDELSPPELVGSDHYVVDYLNGWITFNLPQDPLDMVTVSYGYYPIVYLQGQDYFLYDDQIYWTYIWGPSNFIGRYGEIIYDASLYAGPAEAPTTDHSYLVSYKITGGRTKQTLYDNFGILVQVSPEPLQSVEDYRKMLDTMSLVYRHGATVYSLKQAVETVSGYEPTILTVEFDNWKLAAEVSGEGTLASGSPSDVITDTTGYTWTTNQWLGSTILVFDSSDWTHFVGSPTAITITSSGANTITYPHNALPGSPTKVSYVLTPYLNKPSHTASWGSWIWGQVPPPPADPNLLPPVDLNPGISPYIDSNRETRIWSDVTLKFGFLIIVTSAAPLSQSERTTLEGLVERIKPAWTEVYFEYQTL